ncbi:MAG: alpha/beta hydrolase [Pseudomonadota bacterium]|nr:alpha/beta hydrolase [Pseudomonadota bacterium]
MTIDGVVEVDGHKTFYREDGPKDGPLMVFVHGWPELSYSWRHQLPAMARLGFHAVAPDLRGYGHSSNYSSHDDFAQENVVADMLRLADALGSDTAVWVGHDWGSPTVWNIASHHPDRCRAVASLCVPYATLEYGVDRVIELVDRNVYPVDEYPVGQWDYQLYYQECFEQAQATMEADIESTLKALFRAGNAEAVGQPAMTALIRASGGWFGGVDRAPDLPLDPRVISVNDLAVYSEALRGSGFFGANSYYMNHEVNTAYAKTALDAGLLSMPALFIAARYDSVCESVDSPLTRPMRAKCSNLTERIVDSGHWMAQECPGAVNDILETWLTDHVGMH